MSLERPGPDEALALRFDEPAVADDLAAWCGGHVQRHVDPANPDHEVVVVWVPTARGPRRAPLGAWIVRRGQDDFEPQTAEEFAARFQPVDLVPGDG